MISFYHTDYITLPLAEFAAWGEGEEWLTRAKESGCVQEVEDYINELLAVDGKDASVTDMEINDILWFDVYVHRKIEDKEKANRK